MDPIHVVLASNPRFMFENLIYKFRLAIKLQVGKYHAIRSEIYAHLKIIL